MSEFYSDEFYSDEFYSDELRSDGSMKVSTQEEKVVLSEWKASCKFREFICEWLKFDLMK